MNTKYYQNNGNKLIAEFMGAAPDTNKRWYDVKRTGGIYYLGDSVKDFKYSKSFDWIMPVYEKIAAFTLETENIAITEMTVGTKSCSITAVKKPYARFSTFNVIGDPIEDSSLEKLIDTVFVSIVEFIEWYNKNK